MKNSSDLTLFPDMPPMNEKHSRKDHVTFKANQKRGRHGWLRLTPAYSVHLVEELVAQCGPDERVLDPFCGTGTTALACAQAGVLCHTVDINPFLVWLANVKCAVYTQKDSIEAKAVLERALSVDDDGGADRWVPPIKDVSKWWDTETLALLARIFSDFHTATLVQRSRDLLSIIFCRAMIELSSASFGHQSMSFEKKTPSPGLLPIKHWVCTRFQQVGNEVLLSAHEPVHEGCGVAVLGDARQLSSSAPLTDYTRVITSPPYPNRMSYIRELRPYMYWLGYLESGRQAGELDWQAIGGTWGCATSKLLSWVPGTDCRVPYDGFDAVVEQIARQSKVLGVYVGKYFQDIVLHISSLKAVLVPGASVQYVIGNSKFYDVLLPTEQVYAAIFRDQGFQNVHIETIRKRTSKKELFEYIVSARA